MLVVGSVAFDTIHNAQGTHARVLGGSATYAALSGSYLTEVQLGGVVGRDFPDEAIQMMRERGIDTAGLEIADGRTFHWEGRYTDDLTSRTSIRTDLNVFADFHPKIPEAFRHTPYVMLGNIHPALQIEVLDQLDRPELVVADTMNFWIDGELETLRKLLTRVDVLVINEEEARQLSGKHHLRQVADALRALGPKILIIKQGEYGAFLFMNGETFSAPAFPLPEVLDPTGAGDSFAGGLLGYVASQGDTGAETLRTAVVHGSALASFCVEGISVNRLVDLDDASIAERVDAFRHLVRFAPPKG
jgi:sugar/nucleoside kinase (ribokinase family)